MRNRYLVILLIIISIGYMYSENTKIKEKDILFEDKLAASGLLEEIFNEIKEMRIKTDGSIDKSIDINETGVIGLRYSEITTTLGALESKRTTANPNFAAVVVEMISEAGVKKGETIAINVSSSFPGANFAVLAAAEVLELNTVILSSIGASTYGGNNPKLTYLDMEKNIFESGLISDRSTAFSYGGADDIGLDMNNDILEEIKSRHQDIEFIYIENYEDNINYRMDLYEEKTSSIYNSESEKESKNENINVNDISLFINVGGNIVAGGKSDIGFGFENGYINSNTILNFDDEGLMGKWLSKGVGVINILDIKDLATTYGLSIDPIPMPNLSEEDVFYVYKHNLVNLIILLMISGGGILYYGYARKSEIKRKLKEVEE